MYGQRIREIRIGKGISLSNLSKNSGVSKSYLSIIERGGQKNPSISILMKIAQALHVDLKDLIKPSDHVEITDQFLRNHGNAPKRENVDQKILQQLEEIKEILKMKKG